jgi:hypothetical protein
VIREIFLLLLVLPALWLVWRAATSTRRPAYLYALVLYATIFSTFQMYPFGLNPANVLAAVAVGFEAFNAMRRRRPLARLNLMDVGALLLLSWVLLRTVIFGEPALGLRSGLVLTAIIVSTKLRPRMQPEDLRICLNGLLVGGCVVAFAVLIQHWYSPTLFGLQDHQTALSNLSKFRYTGLSRNPNSTAFMLVLGLAALGSVISWSSRYPKVLRVALEMSLLTLLFSALLLTQSRAGLFTGVAAVVLRVSLLLGASVRSSITAIIILGIAGFATRDLGWLQTVEGSIFMGRPTMASSGRELHVELAIEVMERAPWFGDAGVLVNHARIHYHNATLQIAADNGTPAAIGFLAMLVAAFSGCIRWYAREGGGHIANSLVTLFLAGAMMSMTHDFLSSSISYWLMMGFAVNSGVSTLRAPSRRSMAAGSGP